MPDTYENQSAFQGIAAALGSLPNLRVFQSDPRCIVVEAPAGTITCRLSENTSRVTVEHPGGLEQLLLVFGWAHREGERLPRSLAQYVGDLVGPLVSALCEPIVLPTRKASGEFLVC